jgi:hypothetical protein
LKNTLRLFSISLLINAIAVMFVAKGQGLIAVINPNINADKSGKSVLSNMF